MLALYKSPSETRTSPLVLLDIAVDDPYDLLTVQEIFVRKSFHVVCKFCMSMNTFFGSKRLPGSTAPILIVRLSENFLDYTSSRLTLPVLEAINRNFGR